MRTVKSLLSLLVICFSISSVSAHIDGESVRSYEKGSKVELIADSVAPSYSEKQELAALEDACYEHSEDVQFVSKTLKFKIKPNSIIFDSSRAIPESGTFNMTVLPRSILDQKNLSQTEKIMLYTILRQEAEKVERAYRDYSKSFNDLPISLETGNRVKMMELFSTAKASRSKLIELCGAEAVAPLDEHRNTAEIFERCKKIEQP